LILPTNLIEAFKRSRVWSKLYRFGRLMANIFLYSELFSAMSMAPAVADRSPGYAYFSLVPKYFASSSAHAVYLQAMILQIRSLNSVLQ
jgi:hypothetical protein